MAIHLYKSHPWAESLRISSSLSVESNIRRHDPGLPHISYTYVWKPLPHNQYLINIFSRLISASLVTYQTTPVAVGKHVTTNFLTLILGPSGTVLRGSFPLNLI
jgi:hypothetical protein